MNELSEFSSFILSLASSASYYMGDSPESIKGEVDFKIAQHTIDTICLLKNKTKGNLTPEEDKLIEDVLYKLRITFIKLKKNK